MNIGDLRLPCIHNPTELRGCKHCFGMTVPTRQELLDMLESSFRKSGSDVAKTFSMLGDLDAELGDGT